MGALIFIQNSRLLPLRQWRGESYVDGSSWVVPSEIANEISFKGKSRVDPFRKAFHLVAYD